MLPKQNRLKKKKDCDSVIKQGRHNADRFLVLKIQRNSLEQSRIGFVVSKKISKKAVERNRIKRRLSGGKNKRPFRISPAASQIGSSSGSADASWTCGRECRSLPTMHAYVPVRGSELDRTLSGPDRALQFLPALHRSLNGKIALYAAVLHRCRHRRGHILRHTQRHVSVGRMQVRRIPRLPLRNVSSYVPVGSRPRG